MFVFLCIGNNHLRKLTVLLFSVHRRMDMDYLKHAKRKTIGGEELIFIRCDKDGNVIPEETLRNLSITNSTIERIVSEVAGRISGGTVSEDGVFSEGIITS